MQLDYHELMNLAEWNGVGIQTHLIGAGRTDIKNPTDLITSLFQSLVMNVKRSFLEVSHGSRRGERGGVASGLKSKEKIIN